MKGRRGEVRGVGGPSVDRQQRRGFFQQDTSLAGSGDTTPSESL